MRSIENRKLLLTQNNFKETNLFLTSTYEEIRNDSCTPRKFKSLVCDMATKSHELSNSLNLDERSERTQQKAKRLLNTSKKVLKESKKINYISRIFSFKIELAHKKILQYNTY